MDIDKIHETHSEEEKIKHLHEQSDSYLLQIRLTNNKNLQAEFKSSDLLCMVKKYVDANRCDGKNKYFLVVPFPRKVFSSKGYSF